MAPPTNSCGDTGAAFGASDERQTSSADRVCWQRLMRCSLVFTVLVNEQVVDRTEVVKVLALDTL